jgi:hypothetical protein
MADKYRIMNSAYRRNAFCLSRAFVSNGLFYKMLSEAIPSFVISQ